MLEGRTAVVTGASRGIGSAVANALAREGAAVVVNYLRSADQADQVVEAITQAGGRATALQADVTDPDAVARLERLTGETYGSVDILVNNAGAVNVRQQFSELAWDDYQSQIDATIKSAFHCTQAFLPHLVESGHGRLIMMGSLAATRPTLGSHAYVTAKAGLVGFVRSLALEIADTGVTVNLVEPALVLTDRAERFTAEFRQQYAERAPLGRIASAEEVAEAVVFLASDGAGHITGSAIDLSGGRSIQP